MSRHLLHGSGGFAMSTTQIYSPFPGVLRADDPGTSHPASSPLVCSHRLFQRDAQRNIRSRAPPHGRRRRSPSSARGASTPRTILRPRRSRRPDAVRGPTDDGQRRRLVRPVVRQRCRRGRPDSGRTAGRRSERNRLLHGQRARLGTIPRFWRRFFSTALDEYLQLPAGSPGLAVAEQYEGNPSGFLRHWPPDTSR